MKITQHKNTELVVLTFDLNCCNNLIRIKLYQFIKYVEEQLRTILPLIEHLMLFYLTLYC